MGIPHLAERVVGCSWSAGLLGDVGALEGSGGRVEGGVGGSGIGERGASGCLVRSVVYELVEIERLRSQS
jgi:hypothetical protein